MPTEKFKGIKARKVIQKTKKKGFGFKIDAKRGHNLSTGDKAIVRHALLHSTPRMNKNLKGGWKLVEPDSKYGIAGKRKPKDALWYSLTLKEAKQIRDSVNVNGVLKAKVVSWKRPRVTKKVEASSTAVLLSRHAVYIKDKKHKK